LLKQYESIKSHNFCDLRKTTRGH